MQGHGAYRAVMGWPTPSETLGKCGFNNFPEHLFAQVERMSIYLSIEQRKTPNTMSTQTLTTTSLMTNMSDAQLEEMLLNNSDYAAHPDHDATGITLHDGAQRAQTGYGTWRVSTRWTIDGREVTLKATMHGAQVIDAMRWSDHMSEEERDAYYAAHIECARLCVAANTKAFYAE